MQNTRMKGMAGMKGKIVKYILIGAAVAVVVEAAKRYLTQCGVTDDADYDTDPENDDTEDGDEVPGYETEWNMRCPPSGVYIRNKMC